MLTTDLTLKENIVKNDYTLLRPFDIKLAEAGHEIIFKFDCEDREFLGADDEYVCIRYPSGKTDRSRHSCYVMKPLTWLEGKPVYFDSRIYNKQSGSFNKAETYKSIDDTIRHGFLSWEKPIEDPYAALKKAYNEGEIVQFKDVNGGGVWIDMHKNGLHRPSWCYPLNLYRIKHKHQKFIDAYAAGAKIQFKDGDMWLNIIFPSWRIDFEYRINVEQRAVEIIIEGKTVFNGFVDVGMRVSIESKPNIEVK